MTDLEEDVAGFLLCRRLPGEEELGDAGGRSWQRASDPGVVRPVLPPAPPADKRGGGARPAEPASRRPGPAEHACCFQESRGDSGRKAAFASESVRFVETRVPSQETGTCLCFPPAVLCDGEVAGEPAGSGIKVLRAAGYEQ